MRHRVAPSTGTQKRWVHWRVHWKVVVRKVMHIQLDRRMFDSAPGHHSLPVGLRVARPRSILFGRQAAKFLSEPRLSQSDSIVKQPDADGASISVVIGRFNRAIQYPSDSSFSPRRLRELRHCEAQRAARHGGGMSSRPRGAIGVRALHQAALSNIERARGRPGIG